eukprot:11422190-Ditylum_brightwellii.AAC.1
MQLFTLIDFDLNKVYYFYCNKSNRGKAIAWLDNLPELLQTAFLFEDQCLIRDSNDDDPTCSYCTETAENTDDAICGFDKVLNRMMDTDDDTAPADKNEVEEDHLYNCWTAPPQSVYSRFSKSLSALPTEVETASTVSNSNAPSVTKGNNTETQVFLDRTAKQMDKWEDALEKLNEATKKSEESSLACKLAKLTQRSVELKQQTDNIDTWQITFNEEQKQNLREQ